jgi:hypothetical protein
MKHQTCKTEKKIFSDENNIDDFDNSETVEKKISHSPSSLVDEKFEDADENEQISLELEARPEEESELVDEEPKQTPESNPSEEKSTNLSEVSKKSVPQNPYVKLKPNNQQIPPNQNYRPRFQQRWPNHPNHPRWNNASMQNPNMIPRGGPMGPGPMVNPNFNMRPMRPNQFFNSFPNPMQQRTMQPQRFPFKPNEIRPQPMHFPPVQPPIPQANSNVPGMPRKVLINPNFKGGVEAAKSNYKTYF